MMWFKSCSRCIKGDVFYEEERYGYRLKCAQCGFSRRWTAITRLAGCCSKAS